VTLRTTDTDDHEAPRSRAGPLLRSKITPPGLPGWLVPRPRIGKCIDMGVRRGILTVLSGPAGAGKTTALTAWAVGSHWPGPVAWFTLDEYDNEPGVFWRYLSAALRQAGVPLPDSEPGDRLAGSAAPRVRVTSVLETQHPPAVLLLDNLHLLREDKIAAELAYVLRQAKPGLRVIITTRGEPPLPLHQYLLTGDLTEIQTDQLAFTQAEAKSLLGQHDLADHGEFLDSLVRETEGWAAGLRLAAVAARRGSFAGPAGLRSADHPVTAYLTREMINPQPRHVRDFLLRTSIVDSFSSELAAELTGQEHAAVTLANLVRANTFIQRTGEGWYRYHPLFAGVLRARLSDESPGMAAALRRRAATWFTAHGDLPAAVRYATRAGEWQLAAEAVVDDLAVGRLVDPGGGPDLVTGLRDIPSSSSWQLPQPFLVAAGVALATGDVCTSTTWLNGADHLLHGLTTDQEVPSRFAAEVIRFELARCGGELEAMYSAAAAAGSALSRLPAQARARHPELAGQVLAKQGSAELWLGHLDKATKTLTDAVAPPRRASDTDCVGHLALAAALTGRLGRAEELAGGPVRELANVPADIALAWTHLERDELPAARSSLKRAETGLRTRRDRAASAVACLVAVRLHLAECRPAAAARMLDRAREGWPVPGWLEQRLTVAEARVRTMAGDTVAALDAADRCGDGGELDAAVARAAAWVAAGDLKAAWRALRDAFESAADRPGQLLEPALLDALLLDARLRYADGDRSAGRRSLAQALRMACGEDVRLPFAMAQEWLSPVLRTDAELAEIYRALTRQAQRHSLDQSGQDDVVRAGCGAADGPAVIEPLTGREQEVLSRVAQLMSTAEIASELCISINTVKTHLKSVHRKLAVAHRREAVRRARQLKLL
jgi:LuxR family transcriptional regulator, maltose regulon positive regulatory protein